MYKKAFKYKGLKEVRKNLNALRDLTKKLEADPNATREELQAAKHKIGLSRIAAIRKMTVSKDWDIIERYTELEKRLGNKLMEKTANLFSNVAKRYWSNLTGKRVIDSIKNPVPKGVSDLEKLPGNDFYTTRPPRSKLVRDMLLTQVGTVGTVGAGYHTIKPQREKTASEKVLKAFRAALDEGHEVRHAVPWVADLQHKLKHKQPIVPEHFKYNYPDAWDEVLPLSKGMQKKAQKRYSEYDSMLIKDKALAEEDIQTPLAPIALGGLLGYGVGKAAKLPSTDKSLPRITARSLPTMAGLLGGSIIGSLLHDAEKTKILKKKGITLDRWGRIKSMTPQAQEKYASLTAMAIPPAAALVGMGMGNDYREDSIQRGILGAGLGTLAGIGLSVAAAKRFSKADPWSRYYRSVRQQPPSKEKAAEDIGVVFRKGRFYTPGGSEITTKKDLRKYYRSASMKHHPDRGGDAEKFKKAQKAFKDVIQKSDEWDKLAFLLKKYGY